MHLLIDADSAFYKAGCANETREYLCILDGNVIGGHRFKVDALCMQDDTGCEIEKHKTVGPLNHSIGNLKRVVLAMKNTPHDSYDIYVGGEGNFRYDYFPEYKGNRDSNDKPIHLQEMKDWLIKEEQAITVDGEEVDDVVSYKQCMAPKDTTCIVSIDKDLNNTAGWHYNYAKEELYYVTEEEALLNFARQLLTGDNTDGIPGIKGVGAKTAAGILPSLLDDWLGIVKRVYLERGYTLDYLVQQGRMLWMRRKPNELWDLDYVYEEI